MPKQFPQSSPGLRIKPSTVAGTQSGELRVDSSDLNKLKFHNGTSESPVVTEIHASQGSHRLQNKDLDDTSVVFVDPADTTKQLKLDAGGTTGTSTTLAAAQTANRVITLPDATTTLVGTDNSQVLTNKTISTTSNSITGTANKVAYYNGSGNLASSTVNEADMAAAVSAVNTNPYEEPLLVVSGAPGNPNEITGPISIGTTIPLPPDSRDSGSTEEYIVGKGQLQVYLNGDYLTLDEDWLEVGTSGNPSSDIEINIALVVGDRLTFRNALAGGIVVSGSSTLQSAYDAGNVIATTIGNPFTVGGSAAKVAQFNGDIGVTGVIDPAGVTFSQEALNPLSDSDYGLWVNNSGELMYNQGPVDVNVSSAISGGLTTGSVLAEIENQTGSTINKLIPVRIDSNGRLNTVDVSVEAEAVAIFGIAAENIATGTNGDVIVSGKLTNITTSANFGDVMYVSSTGDLTNVVPDIGIGGFVSGDFVIRAGVVSRNIDNPSNKDLIVSILIVGVL